MSNELTQLFPSGKQISIKDENLTIKPFKFGELPKVFKTIEPITGSLTQLINNRDNPAVAIAGIFATGGDSIVELLVIGAKKPVEWVNDLEMDEGIELLTAVIEVNADFFIQKVLPHLSKVAQKTQTAGQA